MLFLLVVIVLFCVLLYKFAIYALPAAVGIAVGHWAVMTGAGAFGGVFAGILAGGAVFFVGRYAFTASQTAATRSIIAGMFVLPAVWAGYSMVLQLSEGTGTTSSLWRHVLAIIGGLLIGYVTFTRLAAPPRGAVYRALRSTDIPR